MNRVARLDAHEYLVEREIVGGMGKVHLLTAIKTRRVNEPVYLERLAVKTFNTGAAYAHLVRDVMSELGAWGRLDHPGIIRLLGVGMFDLELCAIMPRAEFALDAYFERLEADSTNELVRVATEVALALRYAYTAQNLLHLDIKPSNILFVREESGLASKVSDWGMAGIARVITESNSNRMVEAAENRAMGGTLPYMAPERLMGQATFGPEIDIFSLGMTMLEIESGSLPFENGESIPISLTRGTYHTNARLLLRSADVGRRISSLILSMIFPSAAGRISNYDELLDGLRKAASGRKRFFGLF